MQKGLFVIGCLSFVLLGCTKGGLSTVDTTSNSSISNALKASGELTVTISAVSANDCENSQSALQVSVYNGGADLMGCQEYSLVTQDSRNGETFKCDSPSKFVVLKTNHPEWIYDSSSDTWNINQPQVNVGVPGDYVLHFLNSQGVEKTVSYSLRNPNGNPNACVNTNIPTPSAIPPQPRPALVYPITIAWPANLSGTYASYNDFATAVINQKMGDLGSCISVNGAMAYSNQGFPPCLPATSSSSIVTGPNPTPNPVSCANAQPANDTQQISCPTGQVGAISETRSYSCLGTTWTAGDWHPTANTCVAFAPPPASCSRPTYSFPLINNVQVFFGTTESGSNPPLRQGETISLSFVFNPDSSGYGFVSIAPVTNTYGDDGGAMDTEFSISTCPNDFPATAAGSLCDVRVPGPTFSGQGIEAIQAAATDAAAGLRKVGCNLIRGHTYYLNVRQVSANWADGNKPSCTNGVGCTLRIQPVNFIQ